MRSTGQRLRAPLRLVLAAGLLVACQAAALAREPLAPFRRGIGIHTLLNWGTLRPGEAGRYEAKPFTDANHALPDALLRAAADAGFDFARLTVDPGPFLQLTGPARDGLDAQLIATVRRLNDLGLTVMVDLHGNTQVPAYDPQTIIASADAPIFRAYVNLVARTARLLAGMKDARIAFELMNEPPYGYDDVTRKRWQSQMEALHAAARREAPELTLILTGSHGGDRDGLVDLDPRPFKDSRVLYSFHYYEPHDFTHQGVEAGGREGRYRQYLSDLPYPSDSLSRARVEATVWANIKADPSLTRLDRVTIRRQANARIADYFSRPRNRSAIARDFDRVSEWAQRYAIPGDKIFLGEFGATRSYDNHRAGDPVFYANWIRDVRQEAEVRQFGWAIWALAGTGGMALNDTDGGSALDPTSLLALGLMPPQ